MDSNSAHSSSEGESMEMFEKLHFPLKHIVCKHVECVSSTFFFF